MVQRAMTIEDLSKKLKPLFGKKIDELYFRYSVAGSLEERNEIHSLLTSLYQKHLSQLLDKGVLLEPPRESDITGSYPLGKVSYAKKDLYDFSLREEDWPRHVCVTGMSGSGKTTFAFQILKNLIEKDKPFLVFDWKKSFRPLTAADKSLVTFTIGNEAVSNLFKVNINRPPKGVDPKEWINTLCDLLTESFSASYGVHKILLETLDEAFDSWGIYEGGNHYPNWQHIKKLLEKKAKDARGRETGWYESAERIASVMTFGSFGKIVNYDGKRSMSIEDLFDKRVVLELNSLSNIEKKFFAEYILTYIFKLKKAQESTVEKKFNYAILVDEAHNVFLKKQTNFMSESVTDMIYREMREYGTSLICLDQHISKLSDTVTGNSACHIAFQQQLPQDLDEISQLMQLKDRKDMFGQLNVGEGIVKLSERYTSPFLIKAPYVDLRENLVNDEKITQRAMAILDQNEVEKYDKEFVEEIKAKEPEENVQEKEKETVKETPKEEYVFTISKETPKEFDEKPQNEEPIEKPLEEKKEELSLENPEISKNKKKETKFDILYDFAKEKLEEGYEIYKIEKLLDEGLCEKLYTVNDIIKVMNKILQDKLNEVKERQSNPKEISQEIEIPFKMSSQNTEIFEKIKEISKDETSPIANLSTKKNVSNRKEIPRSEEEIIVIEDNKTDEDLFLDYLNKNQNLQKATTQIYKEIGLSSRKGNVVKNKLLEKGLIKIKEVKSNKGWKKIIQLN